MEHKEIRMVALDLDGTTLNSRGEISARTAKAFLNAMEKGVHIVISTGRTYQSLPGQLFSIKGLEYVITSNGAHITRLKDGELIYENNLAPEAVLTVIWSPAFSPSVSFALSDTRASFSL